MGTAYLRLHPVAGQGLNLALRDAAALAEVVADAIREQKDPGAPEVLRQYQSWRAPEQRTISWITDRLATVFSVQAPGVPALRSLGFTAISLLPGVKRQFARHATGLAGRQSKLVRGLPL